MNIATWSFSTSGRSDLVVLISASACRLDVGVDGEGDVVGLVDGRGLGALLGEAIALLQRGQFQLAHRLHDLVEFPLQPFVIPQVKIAGQQQVERLVKVGFRSLQVSGLVIRLAGRIFLLRLSDQRLGRIGFRNAGLSLVSRQLGFRGSRLRERRSHGVCRRQEGSRSGWCRLAAGRKKQGREDGWEDGANKNSHLIGKSTVQFPAGKPLRCYYAANFRVNETGRTAGNFHWYKCLTISPRRRLAASLQSLPKVGH